MQLKLPARPLTRAVATLSRRLPSRFLVAGIGLTYRRFEPELARLADFCPRRGTALDVGAWYGPWSRALARHVRDVVAFEPNPAVADVLARSMPSNVRVVRAAATDQTGQTTLWVPDGGRGTEGVASLHQAANPGGQPVQVDTTTIDELGCPDVTMIKLDVEGAELAALRGARATLQRCGPALLIELEYRHGPVDEVLAYLGDLGYTGEVLLDGAWQPLAGFDLAEHQRSVPPPTGYLRTVLSGRPRYVNNVLFRAP